MTVSSVRCYVALVRSSATTIWRVVSTAREISDESSDAQVSMPLMARLVRSSCKFDTGLMTQPKVMSI